MTRTHDDTGIGGSARSFPQTPVSAIVAVRKGSVADKARAFAAISRAYWKPVYMHVRLGWRKSNEDAKDLTQGFFANALERDLFARYESERSKFRTYVRVCLESYLSNANASAMAKKRGGDSTLLPFDVELVDGELERAQRVADGPEAIFEIAWAQGIFHTAVAELRAELLNEGKGTVFEVFKSYELDPMFEQTATRPTYAELAKIYGIRDTDVTNYLASARRRLRKAAIAALRVLTSNEEELREEAMVVLGISAEDAQELCS